VSLSASIRRRRLALGGAGLALAAAGLARCAIPSTIDPVPADPPSAGSSPPLLKPPLTYVAIGASDAAGVGVDDPARDNWVAVLGRRLPQPAKVVNLGIPGIRLEEALQVELPPALDARPDLITVWLAVNDVLAGVPLERYFAALDRLLRELRAGTGAQLAVGNVPDAPSQSAYLGVSPSVRPALTADWNQAIATAAGAHGAILVDLYRLWPVVDHPEYIGEDGLHPTVAGYRALAEVFHQVLREQRVV
jgi:lysophospholipase L1-like esterase